MSGIGIYDYDYDVDPTTPTPDELPREKAVCHFCRKSMPDQFFMEGVWAHDACMDAHFDSPATPTPSNKEDAS